MKLKVNISRCKVFGSNFHCSLPIWDCTAGCHARTVQAWWVRPRWVLLLLWYLGGLPRPLWDFMLYLELQLQALEVFPVLPLGHWWLGYLCRMRRWLQPGEELPVSFFGDIQSCHWAGVGLSLSQQQLLSQWFETQNTEPACQSAFLERYRVLRCLVRLVARFQAHHECPS